MRAGRHSTPLPNEAVYDELQYHPQAALLPQRRGPPGGPSQFNQVNEQLPNIYNIY